MEYYAKKSDISHLIHVTQCGYEECEPSHRYGPAVRDHFLLHYIVSGKGRFTSPQGTFTLEKGQGFIIHPGDITTYQADHEEPWVYAWIGYNGPDALPLTSQVGLSSETPIFSLEPPEEMASLLRNLYLQAGQMRLGQMAAVGVLFQLMARIGEQNPGTNSAPPDDEYFMKARWFLEGNYHRSIRISDAANYVGLSRSQLFRIFVKIAEQSPKQYLTALRLRHALPLLESKAYTIDAIAASVGIDSPSRFTQQFREMYGVPPSQWQKNPGHHEAGSKPLLPTQGEEE